MLESVRQPLAEYGCILKLLAARILPTVQKWLTVASVTRPSIRIQTWDVRSPPRLMRARRRKQRARISLVMANFFLQKNLQYSIVYAQLLFKLKF